MQEYEDILLRSYEQERVCYLRILELSEAQREALRTRRPMSEVITILEDKNRIMHEIEEIEQSTGGEKRRYRMNGGARPAAVAAAIDDLSALVERILAVERENEDLFNAAGSSMHRAGGVARVPGEYVVSRYSSSL